jgi:S-adenosylmethionine:tRNA ribosyltransferase-isomerase
VSTSLPTASGEVHENLYDPLAYDYELPAASIAQEPAPRRDEARLLVVDRAGGPLRDARVTDLAGLLAPGDLLVLNDTRVIRARVEARRTDTQGQAEVLVAEVREGGADAMVRTRGRAIPGMRLEAGSGADRIAIVLREALGGGLWRIDTALAADAMLAWLERCGRVPLPPYVKRARGTDPMDAADLARYQTVYAARPGAVAAPTAGLHFTDAMLADLARRGVSRAHVTLHVGPGTFRPVVAADLRDHAMHAERFEVTEDCAAAVRRTRAAGRRVVAVGTTVVRALETAAAGGAIAAARGATSLFIHPPWTFRAVDALVTNFHAPRSTLLVLTAAFGGRGRVLSAYAHAIRSRYRLLSYGDAMLIL